MSYEYLASPYSHPDPAIRAQRYDAAVNAVAFCIEKKRVVYSPICHWHPIALTHDLPKGFEFWEWLDKEMIASSAGILILRITGWQESVGVQAEKKFAELLGLPVEYL